MASVRWLVGGCWAAFRGSAQGVWSQQRVEAAAPHPAEQGTGRGDDLLRGSGEAPGPDLWLCGSHLCSSTTGAVAEPKAVNATEPLLLNAARRQRSRETPGVAYETSRESYQTLCEKHPSFRERSENVDLVVEISIQQWKVFKPDGSGMNIPFDIVKGKGPIIFDPIRTAGDVEKVREFTPDESVPYVGEALTILRKEREYVEDCSGSAQEDLREKTSDHDGGLKAVEIEFVDVLVAVEKCTSSENDSGTKEEAAKAYDIAAIKFQGLNAVTNFEINRYDVKDILESRTLPIGGGAAKRLKEAQAIESSRKHEEMISLGSTFKYGSRKTREAILAATTQRERMSWSKEAKSKFGYLETKTRYVKFGSENTQYIPMTFSAFLDERVAFL
ncbi:uroporphyrinogen decarboxylase chloroplastic [Phtheirospermum japonicum]|uniref:Uroporphyrinogen decarboxylase chloroplastic n=1 Tax=Phtheirospermum japonicum TaxID=374723 RepID=A0A830C8N0_9LAMI|nr:uroporphyrinogen decarboxylase chloroplastic [Phtheirospermum japonicum]